MLTPEEIDAPQTPNLLTPEEIDALQRPNLKKLRKAIEVVARLVDSNPAAGSLAPKVVVMAKRKKQASKVQKRKGTKARPKAKKFKVARGKAAAKRAIARVKLKRAVRSPRQSRPSQLK